MGLIPHAPIYLSLIRTTDIWLLLAIGAAYEFLCRLFLLQVQMKPKSLKEKEAQLKALQKQTNEKRKVGPSAFVETSKLERQLMALEKEVTEQTAGLKQSHQTAEKILLRGGNMRLALLVWFLYYSVPIMIVDDLEVGLGEYMPAGSFLKTLFFPISSFGFGVRISKWGLAKDIVKNSLGALMVMWSSQVTVGKVFDAVDAYCL